MALELVASRIIAPVYGSSIYTWGSIIGIVLAALSVGYVVGGLLADALPSTRVLGLLLAAAGGLVLLIPHTASPICIAFKSKGQMWGALLSSAALFGFPSFLIATVAPYSIRLLARDLKRIGNTAGALYGLSTAGSLAGTFLTAFLFIPNTDSYNILISIGASLIIPAIIVTIKTFKITLSIHNIATTLAIIVITAASVFAITHLEETHPRIDRNIRYQIIASKDTPYCTAFVVEDRNQIARYLQINNHRESGLLIRQPYSSALGYTIAFHSVFGVKRDIKRVLLIGGGGAVIPIEFILAYGDISFDVVEIDPDIIEFAKTYFLDHAHEHYENHGSDVVGGSYKGLLRQNIRFINEDGRMFINRQDPKVTYDAIFLDAYGGGFIPFHLTTIEFLREIKDYLAPDGVVAMNIVSAYRGPLSRILWSMHVTLSNVFESVIIVSPHKRYFEAGGSTGELVQRANAPANIILVASAEGRSSADVREILGTLMSDGYFPEHIASRLRPVIGGIGTAREYADWEAQAIVGGTEEWLEMVGWLPPLTKLGRDPLLRDRFSPVDVWSGQVSLSGH